jgi:phosphopantothenoylcysteine decarboxylase/phosphopantothenate--cysteine ligase
VTSGPTYEPIDPVRFIGNRSSGKTGYAIAEALAEAGAETILVTGPTALPDPPNVKVVHVETAKDMHAACLAEKEIDIAICAAAVADWRPLEQAAQKIKKGEGAPVIALAENPDILAALSKNGPQRPSLVVGFAAETEDCVAHARLKLKRKGCDWILANEVGNGKAFGQDINQMVLLCREEDDKIAENHWPEMSKHDIGVQLVKEIAAALSDKQDMTQRKKKV